MGERRLRIGMWVKRHDRGWTCLLAEVDSGNRVVAVETKCGGRIYNPIIVCDPHNISKSEANAVLATEGLDKWAVISADGTDLGYTVADIYAEPAPEITIHAPAGVKVKVVEGQQ